MNESGVLEIRQGGERHAHLQWKESICFVTKLGGTGTVRVNGAPLEPQQPHPLSAGDLVRIADLEFIWRLPDETALEEPAKMSTPAHRLTVATPSGVREVPLNETAITIGRTEDNDIHIDNPSVSRHHARLELQAGGYEIVDLGSKNGLKFQDRRIARKQLADGDVIWLSKEISLTYQAGKGRPPAAPEQGLPTALLEHVTVVPRETGPTPAVPRTAIPAEESKSGDTLSVDMAPYLGSTGVQESLGMTGSPVTYAPHLVIHLPDRTWQAPFTKDHLSIGRGKENDIFIGDASVSRYHASIERRGDQFLVRDAKSQNGVWVNGLRVESHRLSDGDVLSIGRAKVIFRGAFTSNDLTLMEPPRIDGRPTRRPVVIVPGMMGSELYLGSERLWPSARALLSDPTLLALPGDPRIEARQLVKDVVMVPGILKQEQYSRLGDYLENGLGYTRGKDLLEFAYDWRRDVRDSAKALAETLDRWAPKSPVTIIGHSLGTYVTRYYVERLGGKRTVERVILMGGPHYGAPQALLAVLFGPGILPFGYGDEKFRAVLATLYSAYQILPIYPSVVDQHGQQIDILIDQTWLPESQRPFLSIAREFRRELGYRTSVPCVSVFGYGLKTVTRIHIHRRSDGQWGKVEAVDELAGDNSVPAGSAVVQSSEIHPVAQEHGSLYVDDGVKMRLKVELTRSTTSQGRR